ncbi:hypothetical protein JW859_07740 [bacterium]|nr:hypothetical protein [bacterium]
MHQLGEMNQLAIALTTGGILMAILGFFVGNTKGNGCWGCGLGCFLGPIGIIITLLIPKNSG